MDIARNRVGSKAGIWFIAWPACWLALLSPAVAADAPPQVTEARAVHHAGQTFVTWKEVQPLLTADKSTYGEYKQALAEARNHCRYRIYAADAPIGAANFAKAERIAEVEPLSAYNANGRNEEYLIGQAMIKADKMGELAEGFNGAMHAWTMDSRRMDRYPLMRFVIPVAGGEPAELPPGRGLFVCNPAKAGRRYYAVVSVRADSSNEKDFASNVAGPVEETVGPGEPVRQGKGLHGPYFDFPGTRWVYVQWCAPPLSPRPGMYFNWSVLIPPGVEEGKPVMAGMKAMSRVPAELYFHAAGYSYAQPGSKMMTHSIQIVPHDYPASGWYGFSDTWGTDKPLSQGKVSNHTQKRIIAFLDWARKTLPIDPDQIIAAGSDGAAALALNYADMFAYVWIAGFDSVTLNPSSAKELADAWGPRDPAGKDDQGRTNWEWADLDKLALASAKDLPLFICVGKSWGVDKGYAKGNGRFYRAMQEAHQPLMAYWGWQGERSRGPVGPFDGVWRGKTIARATPIPVFSNSSRNLDQESGGNAGGTFDWKDLADAKERLSVTILGAGGTFDLTFRRLANFKPAPSESLTWSAEAVLGPKAKSGEPPKASSGAVAVGKDGLFTIEKLLYPDQAGSMTVTITRGR